MSITHEIRVGTDLSSVSAVSESISMFGDRYLNRICTATERDQTSDAAERIAARFAAKEAVIKVMRVRGDEPVSYRDIEIKLEGDGAPGVRLHGTARAIAQRRRLRDIQVSLTHDSDMAMAVALGTFDEDTLAD